MSAGNGGERIHIAMQEAQRTYPSYRIRAIDDQGRLIDIL
jgi:hypothetical protein